MGPDISSYAVALAETDGERFLAAQPGIANDRVLTFGDQANRMTIPGFLQADGYQSVYPLAYHDFFGRLIAPELAASKTLASYYNKWGGRVYAFGPQVNPGLVALAGVRWLYVNGPAVPTVPGLVSRWHEGDVTIYEVPSVLPRAFVVGALDVEPSRSASLDALAAASLADLRGSAYAATSPALDSVVAQIPGGLPPPGTSGSATSAGTATITSATPDEVDLSVTAERPGILVLTDVMAPGWVAERDGQAVPIATVDGTFRGIAVNAGTQRVVFRYEPGFTYAGFGLAALTAIILALAAVLGLWRERRARRLLVEGS
jgi:hypothetical protein